MFIVYTSGDTTYAATATQKQVHAQPKKKDVVVVDTIEAVLAIVGDNKFILDGQPYRPKTNRDRLIDAGFATWEEAILELLERTAPT
jgi:predicted secreted acid phosphatase